MITHYDILKVTQNASTTVISAAYNALCTKYHPDNYQDETKKSKGESVIKRLNVAYGVLSDAEKRKIYDESIGISEKVEVVTEPKIHNERQKRESIFKQIDFSKIKNIVIQSVKNAKAGIGQSINENIISRINLNKVKEKLNQSVENAKTLKADIENSVHGNKEKTEELDSNVEIKESENVAKNEMIDDLTLESEKEQIEEKIEYSVKISNEQDIHKDEKKLLIKCNACEKDISKLADKCLNCGSPNHWIHPKINLLLTKKDEVIPEVKVDFTHSKYEISGVSYQKPKWITVISDTINIMLFVIFPIGTFIYYYMNGSGVGFSMLGAFMLLGTAAGALFFPLVIFSICLLIFAAIFAKKRSFQANLESGEWTSSDEKFWKPVKDILFPQ